MIELGLPELLLAAVTVFSPIIAALANQSQWSPKTKNMVAFGVSLLLAVGYLFLTGGLADISDLPGTVLAVYGLQQLVYKQFLEELSKKVEASTSVKPGETVVVEEGEENVVVETGGTNATVEIVDADADETPVAPDYQAKHRGDQALG